MARFAIQQVTIHGSQYPGVRGYQMDSGEEIDSEGSDGTVYETAHHLIQAKPTAEITTLSLKAMLTLLADSTDLPVLALNGSTGIVLYGAAASSNAPGYTGNGTHLSRTALNGVIWASGIRWSVGSKAEMTVRGMFKSTNGTSAAVSASVAANLPTAPIPDLAFTLTALTLNGVSVVGVNSVEIDIDPKFTHMFSTGLPYPTDVIGAGALGRLAIRMRADIQDCDIGSGSGACSAVFTQYATGGSLGSSTCTLTLNANWSTEESVGGANSSVLGRQLVVRPRYSGSTKPLTWAVA